uniref:tripartite tricarboxylate transporter substrate binding protein n=1 Tax=Pararhizobium sp. IMCC3301 TaxID=3067904 RepID=UPI00274069E7|nr:tripartite tricarboxylate transporter substrate binding protein [Pararhizobium sp. IMCC3301]
MNRRIFTALLAAGSLALSITSAAAEEYPSAPIKVIVPNGAGGGTDVTTRQVAEVLGKKLGADLAIINMGGGGTSIGAMEAANADADGYTLLSTHEAFLTSSATGINTMGPSSMIPVAQVAKEVIVLTVPSGSPYTNLEEFYAAAKGGDRKLKLGVNPGAANHFFFLNALSPIDHNVTFVPTGGGADTMKALLSGTIDAGMFEVSAALDSITAGDIVPLAVFDADRQPVLADVPTAKEQGYDVSVGLHYIWYVPAGTDAEIIAHLAKAFAETVNDAKFQETMMKRNITPALITGDELVTTLDARFAAIQEAANKYILGK